MVPLLPWYKIRTSSVWKKEITGQFYLLIYRQNPSVNNEYSRDSNPNLLEMANRSKNKGQNVPALKSGNSARYILSISAYKEREHKQIQVLGNVLFFRLSVMQGVLYLILLKTYIFITYVLLTISRSMYRCVCVCVMCVHIHICTRVCVET